MPDIKKAIRDVLLANSAIETTFARYQFTTGTDEAALFNEQTQEAIIPNNCPYPAGIIDQVTTAQFGFRENKGGESLFDIRVYDAKLASEKTVHDLAWKIWETINRAHLDLDVDGYQSILCVADPPVSLFDPDGFPGYLVQCRVLFVED